MGGEEGRDSDWYGKQTILNYYKLFKFKTRKSVHIAIGYYWQGFSPFVFTKQDVLQATTTF